MRYLPRRRVIALLAIASTGAALVLLYWPAPYPASPTLQSCPGYTAAEIKTSKNCLTAKLYLADKACNVFGTDKGTLLLEVVYETSPLSCLLLQGCILNGSQQRASI
jgi:hypothetical protein